MKAADFGLYTPTFSALVSTNSICQGQQVPILWPAIFEAGQEIAFAHNSFKWANLASHNAGVTVVIVGISNQNLSNRRLFSISKEAGLQVRTTENINAYLVSGPNVIVERASKPICSLPEMVRGNMPYDGGNLLLSPSDLAELDINSQQKEKFVRRIYGSAEFVRGISRYCLWIEDENLDEALGIPTIAQRIEKVREMRLSSSDSAAREMAKWPHRMREMNKAENYTIVLPRITSENREFLPIGIIKSPTVISSQNFALFDENVSYMSIIVSRLHLVWVRTICTTMRTDFSYTNTLGWNTFPVPALTEKNKADLTCCAEDILLAREVHFPATIADLYDPKKMPDNLRAAHDRNDEVLERIYIGRRFKNDTERLEKLFELYTKMTTKDLKTTKSKMKD
jgi:hypothetical protein